MEQEQENQNKTDNFSLLIKNNKKKIFTFFFLIIIILFSYFLFLEFKDNRTLKISENYNNAKLLLQNNKNNQAKNILISVINKKDKFYSPSALNLIIDNGLANYDQTLIFFDTVLSIRGMDKEKKNLFFIKKALFISEKENEIDILNILSPIINSDSVWREKAIDIIVNYYISKGQLEKSEQFKNQKK